MEFMKFLIVLLAGSFMPTSFGDYFGCHFNPTECICSTLGPMPEYFSLQADCRKQDGSLPKFTVNPNFKYTVDSLFYIRGNATSIPAKHFEAFNDIKTLVFEHKPINAPSKPRLELDPNAFDGIKSMFGVITNRIDGLIPTQPALKVIPELKQLYVQNNPVPLTLSENAFDNTPDLVYLNIDDTPIEEVSEKVFANLKKFGSLRIVNSDISKVLPKLTQALTNRGLGELSLYNAGLTEIKKDTLPTSRMYRLYLNSNPITEIEIGAFASIKDLFIVELSDNKLETIDLGIFSGIDTTSKMKITLDKSRSVKTLTASVTDKIPSGEISISSTTVENIDESIKTLLDKTPKLKLYLGESNNLKCEGLKWMTKLECPERVYIGYSRCADKNQYLYQYLKELDPNTTCRS